MELITDRRDGKQFEFLDGAVLPRRNLLPQHPKAVTQNRIGMLSEETRKLLRVAATVGRSFLLCDVAVLMNKNAAELLPAVDDALTSGILICAQERLEFQCDITWQALVESIPKPVLYALQCDRFGRCDELESDDAPAVGLTKNVPNQLTPSRTAQSRWQILTDHERHISLLVGSGLTNRQVAKRLFLSSHTVNYHLRTIFRKLDIRSRVELARYHHEHFVEDRAPTSPIRIDPTS